MKEGLLAEYPCLLPVRGVRLGASGAGLYGPDREDLAIFSLENESTLAAVFTRNVFCAAPVLLARRHLICTDPRYLLINAGNANAGTGKRGVEDCLTLCANVADRQGCRIESILPFSTGVIGEPLPLDELSGAIPAALDALHEENWDRVARSIMTTDRCPKGCSLQLDIDGHRITMTGIAKGAGMICPNMATMLAFIATDAAVDQSLLHACLQDAVDQTFNRITVDGDTSTNDAVVLISTARSSLPRIQEWGSTFSMLQSALRKICAYLAEAIVLDGEGATHLVEFQVEGGREQAECLHVARVVADSLLVKTALHGGDANWGRILAAVGRCEVPDLDIERVDVFIDDLPVVRGGCMLVGDEAESHRLLAMDRYRITIRLGRGESQARILGCDLSAEYVRINADYRS